MRRWERQEAASPGANADVVAVPLGEPVVYSHRRQRAVQRSVAATADGDDNGNAPLPPPPQVEGCDESPKAQIGTIIDGSALTGFVVVVAMAVVLLGLIVVEAVPMAIDWVRSRREEKKNAAAEKEGLESVAPSSNAV